MKGWRVVDTEERVQVFALAVRDSPHNLVSRHAREELLTRHIPECLAFAAIIPAATQVLVDVGSGGGLPGVIIAIQRPDITVHLVESRRKKASFLQEITDELQLNVVVHNARAERVGRGPLAGTADVVTARAVASLAQLATLAAPLLAPDGMLYAIKGARWSEELELAQPVIERAGLTVVATPTDLDDPPLGALPRVVALKK